jgi:uncharacterized membrane protein
MIHTILILGHASAGAIALVFGCVVLRPPAHFSLAFRIYSAALLTMVMLLVAVIVYDWGTLSLAQRVTFSLLAVLGTFTAARGGQAYRALNRQLVGWRTRYVDHVGFTVIALFDGFAIVFAVDSGAPLPLILLVGVLGVVAGVATINRVKSRVRSAPDNAARSGQSTDTAIDDRAGR